MQTPFSPPRSAYVHVPFCAHRCGYCDFTLVARKDHLIEPYLAALERELSSLGQPHEVETLFFGGGTPTHLNPAQLETLLRTVNRWLPLAAGGECSLEANPFGLTAEKAGVLSAGGVNRVSLGVQSFSAPVLELLERDHRAAQIESAMTALSGSTDNIGLDLIFGVPGQSPDVWQATLATAIGHRPAHISTYGLTYEKGTTFWTRRARQELQPLAENDERRMYELAMDVLPAGGYRQYELSNFALPGRECRHNEVYWQGLPYYGFGPGAASYVQGVRRTNHRSVSTWLKRTLAGESGVQESETLSSEARAREAAWLALRRAAGIDRELFARRFDSELLEEIAPTVARLVSCGWLESDERSIRLTREGRFVADTVAAEFL